MKMYIDLSNVIEYEFARLQGLCLSRGIFWISGDKSVIGKSLFKQVLITDCLSFCGDEKITHTVSQAMEEIEKLPIDTDRVLTPFSKNKENFIGWRGILLGSLNDFDKNKKELVTLKGITNFGYFEVYENAYAYAGFLPIYPPEEKEKQLMNNRQLAEWLARGNGQYKDARLYIGHDFYYGEDEDEEPVSTEYLIRSWASDEWVKPTVDIYNRDCTK